MRNLIRLYQRLLYERPLVTNVLTTCIFMTTGDITSQYILQDKDKHDWHQTARFALAGFIFVGPVVRACLVTIDKLFGPTSSLLVLSKKVLFDQGLIAPIFLAANITVLTLIQTQSLAHVKGELDRSYFSILKMNYTFWPFVSMTNFYFIPLAYRQLFGASAALVWNSLFSYKLYQKKNLASIDDR